MENNEKKLMKYGALGAVSAGVPILAVNYLWSMDRASNINTVEIAASSETPVEAILGDEVEEMNVINSDDSMSFGDSFAAAREMQGPGGFFEWKGNVFNTFYKEEWEAMSFEDKNDFLSKFGGLKNHQIQEDNSVTIEYAEYVPPVRVVEEAQDPNEALHNEFDAVEDRLSNNSDLANEFDAVENRLGNGSDIANEFDAVESRLTGAVNNGNQYAEESTNGSNSNYYAEESTNGSNGSNSNYYAEETTDGSTGNNSNYYAEESTDGNANNMGNQYAEESTNGSSNNAYAEESTNSSTNDLASEFDAVESRLSNNNTVQGNQYAEESTNDDNSTNNYYAEESLEDEYFNDMTDDALSDLDVDDINSFE